MAKVWCWVIEDLLSRVDFVLFFVLVSLTYLMTGYIMLLRERLSLQYLPLFFVFLLSLFYTSYISYIVFLVMSTYQSATTQCPQVMIYGAQIICGMHVKVDGVDCPI